MKHKIRRFCQKIVLFIIKNSSPQYEREKIDYEKECISVCMALIHKKESVLLLSPISGKRFIKSDDNQIFIIIDRNQVTIVNHQYSYTINIWGKAMEKIIRLFDVETEKRREKMEAEIRSNVKHSLGIIYKNLTNEKNTK